MCSILAGIHTWQAPSSTPYPCWRWLRPLPPAGRQVSLRLEQLLGHGRHIRREGGLLHALAGQHAVVALQVARRPSRVGRVETRTEEAVAARPEHDGGDHVASGKLGQLVGTLEHVSE
eukprot:scaffold6725_cov117-Isochrysis_galbana.AAC.9